MSATISVMAASQMLEFMRKAVEVMRLIDADALKINMDKGMQGSARDYLKFYQMAVDDQPTAYSIDKVVEQLKERAGCLDESAAECDEAGKIDKMLVLDIRSNEVKKAIEIVKKGGTE